MGKIGELVKRYQLTSFFMLTYIVTWGLWIPFARLYFRTNLPLAGLFIIWGVFGPALAGILVTRATNQERSAQSRKVPLVAFVLGLVVSALVFAVNNLLQSRAVWDPAVAVGQLVGGLIAAIPPAYVIASAFSRNQAAKQYLHSLIRPRGSIVYYLVALLLPPLRDGAGALLSTTLGQTAYYTPPPLFGLDAVRVVSTVFVYQFFYGNTLGEEVGWRGFALPRLQARHSPLIASFIVALFWFPWHLPLKWANPDVIPYGYYALSFIPSSILLTWIYNRTNGSTMAAGIAHASINVSGKILFGVSDSGLIAGFMVAMILILSDRMWVKKTQENPILMHRSTEEGPPSGVSSV